MVIINESSETLRSIKMHGYISLFMLFTNIGIISHLYQYFKQNNTQITHTLKMSFLPFTVWIIASLLFLTMNNDLIPGLNENLFLINNYCHVLSKIYLSFGNIIQQTLPIFLLSRIKYIFDFTPFKLSVFNYFLNIAICIFLCIANIYIDLSNVEPTIFIANDDPNLLLCQLEPVEFDNMTTYFSIDCIYTLQSLYLLYLLYKKNKLFNEIIHSHHTSDIIDVFEANSIDNNMMKRTFYLFIFSKVVEWIIIALYIAFGIKYSFGVSIVICWFMLYSMDHTLFDTRNENENVMSPQESQEYLDDIMARYYSQ